MTRIGWSQIVTTLLTQAGWTICDFDKANTIGWLIIAIWGFQISQDGGVIDDNNLHWNNPLAFASISKNIVLP